MGKLRYVRFHFSEPYHIGEIAYGFGQVSRMIIHSDTLWGAIASNWVKLYGSIDSLIQPYKDGKEPFIISSAFPIYNGRFLVKKPLIFKEISDFEIRKKIKNIEIIPLDILEDYLEDNFKEYNDLGSFWKSLNEEINIIVEPKNRLGPFAYSSNIYYVLKVFASKNVDFYFLIYFNDEKFLDLLKPVLKLLSENGIGGLRSKGCGRFDYAGEEIFQELDTDLLRHIKFGKEINFLISLLSPNDPDIQEKLKKSYYEIIERGGWAIEDITKMQVKEKRILMIKEGSIMDNRIRGRILEVNPVSSFTIYRYGLGFYLPWREEG